MRHVITVSLVEIMMASWHGNTFCITGSNGHWWIPHTMVMASLVAQVTTYNPCQWCLIIEEAMKLLHKQMSTLFYCTVRHFQGLMAKLIMAWIADTHLNSLWSSDTTWWHRNSSTLGQVMACCLMAPSHYMNQCWIIISVVQWFSSAGNFTTDTLVINRQNYLETTHLKFH